MQKRVNSSPFLSRIWKTQLTPNPDQPGCSTSLYGLSIEGKHTCYFLSSCTSIQNSSVLGEIFATLFSNHLNVVLLLRMRSTLGSILSHVRPHLLGITQELLPNQNLAWQGLMGGDAEGRVRRKKIARHSSQLV